MAETHENLRRELTRLILMLDGERGVGWDELPVSQQVERLRLGMKSIATVHKATVEQLSEMWTAITQMQETRKQWNGRQVK